MKPSRRGQRRSSSAATCSPATASSYAKHNVGQHTNTTHSQAVVVQQHGKAAVTLLYFRSVIHNLKELRPGSSGATEVRILFVFDLWRSTILLVAGDKAGNWSGWYRDAIPHAEQLYGTYLKERAAEQEPPP